MFRLGAFGAAMACGLWCVVAQSAPLAPFTKEQADAGYQEFMTSCAACHGEHLAGVSAPALNGATFQASWSKHTIGDFFAFVQTTMPVCDGGALPSDSYADIVAFLLEQNGAQAGGTPSIPGSTVVVGDVIHAGARPADAK